MLSQDECFEAVRGRELRYDGLIYTAVSSTRIYCRPTCSARLPKRENCTFFATAAEAEAAGYRPCLKCRPELAPGAPAGVRVVAGPDGATPGQQQLTSRLLLAKSLLTDTALPLSHIARACGFPSADCLEQEFAGRYRMPTSRLRKKAAGEGGGEGGAIGESFSLLLGYRKPYRFDLLLGFLQFRAIEGVESVANGVYRRSVRVRRSDGTQDAGWIAVEDVPAKSAVRLTISTSLVDHVPLLVEKTRRLFDTDCDPARVDEGLADFHRQVPANMHVEGIRLPCSFDGFEMAVRAVLGQQITVKAANTLAGRLAAEFASEIATPFEDVRLLFPTPEDFLADDAVERLGALGVIRQRSQAICAIAGSVANGSLTLAPGAPADETARALTGIRGIGPWTAQYILMRALAHPDAFPSTDYGVKLAFPDLTPSKLEKLSAPWSPYRSYAVMTIWSTL